MNISHREITIIVIIFIIFLLYLYYTKSIEPFESNKALENIYKDVINNLYNNIDYELNGINNNSEIMKSVCNIIKNNRYNLKKISQSHNLKMKINNIIKNNLQMVEICQNMIVKVQKHDTKDVFDIIKNIYMDKMELYNTLVENDKKLIKILEIMMKHNWETNEMSTDVDSSIFDEFSSTDINKHIKKSYQKINEEITKLIDVINNTKVFEEVFKGTFKKVFVNLIELNKNLLIRRETFNLYHIINRVYELYEQKNSFSLSTNFINSHNQSINIYKTNMTNEIKSNINNIKELIDDKPINILSNDVEVQYLNTVDINNDIIHNFCKKIKKLDKPNENNLMFLRFSKEFVDKKNKHIERLQKEIDNIQNQLYEEEVNNFNINKIRINDQASKQYAAVKKAKENIENSKKFKVNIS